MKKAFILVLCLLFLCSSLFVFASCADAERYYNEDNPYDWIEFGRGDWVDRAGNSGVYDRDGSQLTFYQDDVEVFTGTLKDGTFTMKMAGFAVGVYRTTEAKAAFEKEKGKA